MALFSVLSLTFLTNFTFDGPSSGFQNISLYFDVSIQQTSGLLSWLVLALGLSNFFWIPTAAYFGKRPVFLAACTIVFVCAIWGAASKSFGSLLASTVVGGFGGGASEAVGAAVVNDLYFLHERGRMMGIYMLAISWGSSVGPLIGGFMIERVGW
jgi:MFS family permease